MAGSPSPATDPFARVMLRQLLTGDGDMRTTVRNAVIGAGAITVAVVGFTVYHDMSANEDARAFQAKLWAHEGALVDACDAAYGQGRLTAPDSLSDEAKLKYQRSTPANLISSGEATVVVLVPDKKVCRVHNTTYEVLEKL